MAAEDVINTAYLRTLGRPADSEGLAFYSAQLEAGRPVGEILADLNFAVESGAESPALDSSDVDQFNNLVASGRYTQAAQFAASKGVDPAVTADYIGQNAANLGLPSDFRMNAADVSSLAEQSYGPPSSLANTSTSSGSGLTLNTANLNPTRDDVIRAYENILGRPPESENVISFYTNPANLSTGAGLTGLPALQALLADSPEGRAKAASVNPAGVGAVSADSPEGRARDLLNRAYQTTLNRAPDQAGIDFYLPKIISGEFNESSLIPAITGGAASGADQQAAIDFALQTSLGEFDRLVASGDFTGAKSVLDQSINQYYLDPTASYANIAEYLNEDPKFADIRKANEGQLFDVDNVRSFGEKTIVQAPVLDKDGNVASASPDQVIQAYRDLLNRSPDPAGLAYYTTGEGAAKGIDQIRRDLQYAVDTGAETPVLGDGPFGGYYAQPGIGPYGGVFGVGTEQFEQQSDPFSGAQARARSLINNRLTPLTDNVPIDPRPPAPFGGYVAANDVAPNPFAYRQTLSPNTLAALAAEATPATGASEAPMRRGGYINQGITAVRR
jgi:hypothetical protein